MNQMNQYVNYYWNSVQEWWRPPKTELTPYLQLMQYLAASNIHFETKQSDQKIVHERIGMLYTELTRRANKNIPSKFQQFFPDNQMPLQYVKQTENTQCSDSAQAKKQGFVTICGKLKIESPNIKITLFVTILLHSQIQNSPPIIYVRNNNSAKLQPDLMARQYYEIVVGGVRVKQSVFAKVEWQKYNASNLLNLMELVSQCLHQHFPFVKRKHQIPELTQQQTQTLRNLRNKLQNVLGTNQRLQVLSKTLTLQNKYLSDIISQTKQDEREQINYIQKFLSQIEVQTNESLLEEMTVDRACQDCLNFIDAKFNSRQMSYEEAIQSIKLYSEQSFESKFKISLCVGKMEIK